MKPQRIKVRGFKGIKKGLGRDEIELDLSGLSGLIALAGANGLGKTTLLDNMHMYPVLGSRKKALSHHVFLRDSCRDYSFIHDGDLFRTKIKIDSESSLSEGFLWVNNDPLVKGKISEYKAKTIDIFGSQNLFFNSAFCAQNSPKLSTMLTGDLRDLFAEFLRLDELQQKHETAKQCKNILSGKLEGYNISLEPLQATAQSYDDIKGSIENEIIVLSDKRMAYLAEGSRVDIHTEIIDQKKKAFQRNEITRAKLAGLKKAAEDLKVSDEKRQRDIQDQLISLRNEYITINNKVTGFNELLTQKDKILQASTDLISRQKLLNRLNGEMEILRAKAYRIDEYLRSIATQKQTIIVDIKQYNPSHDKLSLLTEIDRLRDIILQLKKDPSCVSTICPAIKVALDAKERLPNAERELKVVIERDEKWLSFHGEQLRIAEQFELRMARRFNALCEMKNMTKESAAIVIEEIKSLAPIAEKKGQIETASQLLESAQADLDTNTEKGKTLKSNLDKMIEKQAVIMARNKAEIKSLEIELFTAVTLAEIQKEEMDLSELTTTQEKCKTAIEESEKTIAILQERLLTAEKAKKQIQVIAGQKESMIIEAEEWAWLKDAFSKDRLQALEIAGAAPTITGYANRLLSAAFGAQAMVKLQTQDDTGKEVLNIQVIDEDAEEVELGNRSGGQQVWALKALRLAMAMLSKEKSGKNFQTILTDEEDGALDADKAVKFIHLYRAFMAQGNFESCYYISHKPECVSMADHVLEFKKGSITIN